MPHTCSQILVPTSPFSLQVIKPKPIASAWWKIEASTLHLVKLGVGGDHNVAVNHTSIGVGPFETH